MERCFIALHIDPLSSSVQMSAHLKVPRVHRTVLMCAFGVASVRCDGESADWTLENGELVIIIHQSHLDSKTATVEPQNTPHMDSKIEVHNTNVDTEMTDAALIHQVPNVGVHESIETETIYEVAPLVSLVIHYVPLKNICTPSSIILPNLPLPISDLFLENILQVTVPEFFIVVSSGVLVSRVANIQRRCETFSFLMNNDGGECSVAVGKWETSLVKFRGGGEVNVNTNLGSGGLDGEEERYGKFSQYFSINIGFLYCQIFIYLTPERNTSQNNSKIEVFYTASRKACIHFSTFYLSEALTFFSKLVGASYPFPSFKVIFTDSCYASPIISGSLVIVNASCLVEEFCIDQVYETRELLCFMLASMWFGKTVAAATVFDTWIVVGLAGWMTQQFLRKLHGHNEDKFKIRKDMDRVCLLDVNQLPLCPINVLEESSDLFGFSIWDDLASVRSQLIRLKAPLVLQMLDKRMGKGLTQKIASKIMVSSISGELTSGLTTLAFLKYARKISGKIETKEFADQWIFGSGCPILNVSYFFNRKKMVIELKISQKSTNHGVEGATLKFSGPFIVRVQEPSGTFDTEIKIEELKQQYDIIYHTKYKRIRKKPMRKLTSKRGIEASGAVEDDDSDDFDDDDATGIGESRQDINEISSDLHIAEPDRITFEWLRVDPDNVWLCYRTFEQEDFMWSSILRKDKELGGQYEAIAALSNIITMASCNTLTALIRDSSIFYRLRMEAVLALVNVNFF